MLKFNKLNIGCGKTDYREEYWNTDFLEENTPDEIVDLKQLPLPYKDNRWEEIICFNVLQYLTYGEIENVLFEFVRICKPEGIIKIDVPHYFGALPATFFRKSTHFTALDFYYLAGKLDGVLEKLWITPKRTLNITKIKILLPKGLHIMNHIVEPLINLNMRTQYIYENSCLGRLFPPRVIYVEIKKRTQYIYEPSCLGRLFPSRVMWR